MLGQIPDGILYSFSNAVQMPCHMLWSANTRTSVRRPRSCFVGDRDTDWRLSHHRMIVIGLFIIFSFSFFALFSCLAFFSFWAFVGFAAGFRPS
jgi:hypothetical protein